MINDLHQYQLIFSEPSHVNLPLSWIEHIPFAFYIVSKAVPKIIVELGVHTGNSLFAFSKAVKYNNFDTKIYGIDNFIGDEHANYYNNEVYESVRGIADEYYNGMTKIIKSDFDDALNLFEDNSIDLLHIDGFHSYNSAKHDFESWFPKMKKNGIILMHDILFTKRSFGTWIYWKELQKKYNFIELRHGYGLGMILLGNNLLSEYFMNIKTDKTEYEYFNNTFSSLGRKLDYFYRIKLEIKEHTQNSASNSHINIINKYLENANIINMDSFNSFIAKNYWYENEYFIQKIRETNFCKFLNDISEAADSGSNNLEIKNNRNIFKTIKELIGKVKREAIVNTSEKSVQLPEVSIKYHIDSFSQNYQMLEIRGWLFDDIIKIKKLELKAENKNISKVFPIKYGQPRKDVEDFYANPNGFNSGFMFNYSMPSELIHEDTELSIILHYVNANTSEVKIDVRIKEISISGEIGSNISKSSSIRELSKVEIHITNQGNVFFTEIARIILCGFMELNFEVSLKYDSSEFGSDTLNIVVAPHEFFYFNKNNYNIFIPNLIIVNLEQFNTHWFSLAFKTFKKALRIWEIDKNQYQNLSESLKSVSYLQLGHTELYEAAKWKKTIPKSYITSHLDRELFNPVNEQMEWSNRPFDFVFIGAVSERRSEFFAKYAEFFSDYNCFFFFHDVQYYGPVKNEIFLDTETAYSIIQRSKVFINLHQSDYNFFEWHRIVSMGFWSNTLVFSEEINNTDIFQAEIDFIEFDFANFGEKARFYLDDYKGRTLSEQIAYQTAEKFKKELKLKDILSKLIIDLHK